MADILFLRGAPALSVFRLQGLQQLLQDVAPGARIVGADYWHFAKLKQELTPEARRQLAELLEDRPMAARRGRLFLVTPRVGTISPWSSKATDIAWNCGLADVERIERGIAYDIEGVSEAQLSAVTALLHDRMVD